MKCHEHFMTFSERHENVMKLTLVLLQSIVNSMSVNSTLGLRFYALKFGILGSGCRVKGFWSRVQDCRLRV